MDWKRKSRSWLIRLKIVVKDYHNDRDLSWAKNDTYPNIKSLVQTQQIENRANGR